VKEGGRLGANHTATKGFLQLIPTNERNGNANGRRQGRRKGERQMSQLRLGRLSVRGGTRWADGATFLDVEGGVENAMPFRISSSRLPSRWCPIARLSFPPLRFLLFMKALSYFLTLLTTLVITAALPFRFTATTPVSSELVSVRRSSYLAWSILKLAIRQPRSRAPTFRGPLSCLLGSSPVILFPHQPVHCQARAFSKFSLPLDDLSLPAPARQQASSTSLDYRTGQL
jgi:hypothetical protein